MQCLIPGLKWSELDGKAQAEMSLGRAHACGRAELALQASSCCFLGSSKLLALCLLLPSCSGPALLLARGRQEVDRAALRAVPMPPGVPPLGVVEAVCFL